MKILYVEYIYDRRAELVINPACSHYLPVGIHKKEQLKKWIQDRGIPVTRDSIAKDLEKSGISPFKLMLLNCGLSLTDHYWICRQNEHFLWKDINLYTNPFRASFSLDIQDEIESIVSRTNFIPSWSLKGDLKKKWIIDEEGIRRLVRWNKWKTSKCLPRKDSIFEWFSKRSRFMGL